MSRIAGNVAEAADALEAWLTQTSQARAAVPRNEHPGPPASIHPGQPDQDRSPSSIPLAPLLPRAAEPSTPLRLANTDWLHHALTISGPVPDMAAFQMQAAGGGVIPWHLDLDRMEEGWFHLLAAPPAPQERSLSVAGARILAAQLRDAVGRRHELAVAQAASAKSCLFDLHALLPMPAPLLRRGPDDPASLAWLWEHWGTTQALRRVTSQPAPPVSGSPDTTPDGQATLRISFWSADWTPWRALEAVRERFPALRFDVRPTYDAV